MTASLTIGVLVYRRYVTQTQPAGMISALKADGHRVILLDPQFSSYKEGNLSWLNKIDLIIARGRILGLLYMLGWVEMQDIPANNQRVSLESVHNESEMTFARPNSRFSTPRAFREPLKTLSCHVHNSCYTVIVNPIFGGNNKGLRVVNNPDEMVGFPEATAHIKQYLPNNDCDLKLYGIGDHICVVHKPSLFHHSMYTKGVNIDTN